MKNDIDEYGIVNGVSLQFPPPSNGMNLSALSLIANALPIKKNCFSEITPWKSCRF